MIVGDGVVGRHACNVASGLGANVTVFGITPERAPEFERHPAVKYVLSTPAGIAAALRDADLLVGAVLRVGARAEHVITKEMVAGMPAGLRDRRREHRPGRLRRDVAAHLAFGSRSSSHHGVTHYCVTNMPGAYPRTATIALTAATLPYVRRLAGGGLSAVAADAGSRAESMFTRAT